MIIEKIINSFYPGIDCSYEEKMLNLESQNKMIYFLTISLAYQFSSMMLDVVLTSFIKSRH